MYAVLECAVCAVLMLAIAACFFGFWAASILLQEVFRRSWFLVKGILVDSRSLTLELQPLPVTSNVGAVTRKISRLANTQ